MSPKESDFSYGPIPRATARQQAELNEQAMRALIAKERKELRQQAAIAAMAALVGDSSRAESMEELTSMHQLTHEEIYAVNAVALADALVAELEKEG